MTATLAEPQAPGFDLQVMAGIAASLDSLNKRAQRDEDERNEILQAIFPIEVPPQSKAVASNAVNIANAELLGPRSGWCWDVRRITVSGLASASESVNIYRVSSTDSSAAVNANLLTTLAGPNATYAPGLGAAWLRAGQSIMIAGGTALSGGTSLTNGETVTVNADAVQVAARWVGAYLL